MLDGWSVTTNCQYHKGGRVWILWRPSLFDVQILQYDAQFIHTKVHSRVNQQDFYLTMIYAFNDVCDRLDLWHKLEVINLNCLFDHCPCIITNIKIGAVKKASFKYLNMWGQAPGFKDKVGEVWGKHYDGHKMFSVVKRLKSLKPVLKKLNMECYSDIENKTILELNVIAELKALSKARNSFLQQKAKLQWLEEGDQNTAYFHGAIKKRQMRNKGPCCTQEQATSLMLPVTNEEIKGIFFSTPIEKSPGPDGYTSGFFKDAWHIVGLDINAINITLIPKCERPTSVKHFRLIACSNMIYKVISKLLYNGLSVILPDIVHENQATLKEDIKQVTGFAEGQMPFRYLGVPIQPTKLTKKECNILAEKMVNRIRSLGAKKLSYAGRLTLINYVLNSLYSYWSNIFILPKSILRRIEAICRNYLWDGSAEYHRVPLVGWDTVTLPKIEGGLGIKKAEVWNVAIVAKLVDWIYSKSDSLPADAAWTWRSICKVKELMKDAYTDGQWQPDLKGYTLIMHNWMNTREKLYRFACCSTDACCICENATEIQPHLFFECDYNKVVVALIQDWCGACISMSGAMAGGYGNVGGKLKQQVSAIILTACIYHIWAQRNSARINGIRMVPSLVAQNIIEVVRQRIKFKCNAKMSRRDEVWLDKLGIRL
ncbi:uncharacterized protein LOC141637237 [Silene latifolia]|uniref:uncharacterized protein LOC141637237 n=1 Tax=Silene latifolia TaxID=37657 RepID=UPI003D76F771